tara:strand:+ start:129 stop:569 length:441 start_codon:yes stop_codon:yes gene_type:complete
MYRTLLTCCIVTLLFTGCSSVGSMKQTRSVSQVVKQIDTNKIEQVAIQELHNAFLDTPSENVYQGTVVEIGGDVIKFEMSEEELYTITIRQNDSDAVCIFDTTISKHVGEGRLIYKGASITIRGQCFASGLFSSQPFTLDGCIVVN